MSNFQKYIATEQRTYPSVDLTAVPGFVYDFGTLPVPGDGRWQSDAGPATGVFDNTVSVTAGNVIGRSGGYVYTTSGPPTTGNFAPPMLCYDLANSLYACVGSGNPGTWQQLSVLGTGTSVPTVGSFTYDTAGNPLTDPDGNTYTWNADGTPHTQTKGGVTRTFNWNTDGTLASVA